MSDEPEFVFATGTPPEKSDDDCNSCTFLIPLRHKERFLSNASESAPDGVLFECIKDDGAFCTIESTWRTADSSQWALSGSKLSPVETIKTFAKQSIGRLLNWQHENDTKTWSVGPWTMTRQMVLDSVAHSSLFMGRGLRNKRNIENCRNVQIYVINRSELDTTFQVLVAERLGYPVSGLPGAIDEIVDLISSTRDILTSRASERHDDTKEDEDRRRSPRHDRPRTYQGRRIRDDPRRMYIRHRAYPASGSRVYDREPRYRRDRGPTRFTGESSRRNNDRDYHQE